jgi:hypothetical protein
MKTLKEQTNDVADSIIKSNVDGMSIKDYCDYVAKLHQTGEITLEEAEKMLDKANKVISDNKSIISKLEERAEREREIIDMKENMLNRIAEKLRNRN